MARQLYLYSGITPNIDNGAHLVFNQLQAFLDYLQPNLFKTIPLNNYRINADTIKVAKTNDFDDLAFNKISYVIDADIDTNNVNYFKAFFVNSFVAQSDMIIFKITLDFWATYQNDIKLNNAIVTRCNRKLPFFGYYDDIKATITNPNFFERLLSMGGINGSWTDAGIKYIDESDVRIIFLARVVTERNAAGTISESIMSLFGIDISDIRTAFGTQGNTKNGVQLATDAISHIYAIPAQGGVLNQLEVEIVRAWIVTSDMALYRYPRAGYQFKSKPYYADHAEMTLQCYFINSTHLVETKSISGTEYNINYKYYAGVYGDGLEIKNEIGPFTIEFEYIVTDTDIQISVMQGNKQKDITSAFEVSLSGQSQEQNNLEKLAYWCHNISNAVGSAKNMITTGLGTNGVGALVPAVQYVLGELQNVGDVRPSGTITKGGGASTFSWYLSSDDITNHLLNYPFYFTRFLSAYDENKNAKRFGAQYVAMLSINNIYSLVSYIDAFSYLGEDQDFNLDFVALDACVEGVPLDALNYFRNLLHNGLYLKQL